MGFFDKLFNKNKEVIFKKVEEEILMLSNQNGMIENPTKEDLKNYLNLFYNDEDQFITLSLKKAKNGIRYVQACFAGTKLIVQLGLEENNSTKLVEKICTQNAECSEIFYKFYDYGIVDNVDQYKPVQF